MKGETVVRQYSHNGCRIWLNYPRKSVGSIHYPIQHADSIDRQTDTHLTASFPGQSG